MDTTAPTPAVEPGDYEHALKRARDIAANLTATVQRIAADLDRATDTIMYEAEYDLELARDSLDALAEAYAVARFTLNETASRRWADSQERNGRLAAVAAHLKAQRAEAHADGLLEAAPGAGGVPLRVD